MRKRYFGVALAIVLSFSVVGCGKINEPEVVAEAATEKATTEATTAENTTAIASKPKITRRVSSHKA